MTQYKYLVHYISDIDYLESVDERHHEAMIEITSDTRITEPEHYREIAAAIGREKGFTSVDIIQISETPEVEND